jgi:hypothetical protein
VEQIKRVVRGGEVSCEFCEIHERFLCEVDAGSPRAREQERLFFLSLRAERAHIRVVMDVKYVLQGRLHLPVQRREREKEAIEQRR